MTRRQKLTSVLLLAAAPGLAHAENLKVASAWLSAPVTVDGAAGEWPGHLTPLADYPILVGFQNDADYLYLCVKTSDHSVKRQIARLGLTVWVDAEGKKNKHFGVRFPAGSGPRREHGRGGRPESAPGEEGAGPEPALVARELELIGPTEEDRLRIPVTEEHPVKAALGDESGVMVIELRLPLRGSEGHPLAIGAASGSTIMVGLQTELPKREEREGGSRGGGMPGGEGPEGMEPGGLGRPGMGHGGMGHGGMGRGMGGERDEMPESIKVWARVTLATGPAAQAPGN